MQRMKAQKRRRTTSLEELIEQEDTGIDILHPGNLDMTRELAELCHLERGQQVLDTSTGTGAGACYLAQHFDTRIYGIDISWPMLQRARLRNKPAQPICYFIQADAHALPFPDDTFDCVISECTLCLLDKLTALTEMVRVARPGGYIGMHDICWQKVPPAPLAARLARLEGERPETLPGWGALFRQAGLVDIVSRDRSKLLKSWTRDIRRRLGWQGQLRVFLKLWRDSGLRGLFNTLISERIFTSQYMGYGLVAGRKPLSARPES